MRIGLYGDSTQVGISRYGGVDYVNEYPPAKVLQMFLDRKYGDGEHCVSNYGIKGSTIIQALDSPLLNGKNVVEHMQCQCDDIVVANWGINDAYVAGNTANAHRAYYTCLKGFVEAQGKIFVYESPNPMNNAHDPILAGLDAAVKTIPGIACSDVNGQVRQYYPQWAGHLSDDTHPNAIMYFWIGSVLFKSTDAYMPDVLRRAI
ncbi:hypothetical protein ACVMIX_004340 [Rhizobium leguminosarum]